MDIENEIDEDEVKIIGKYNPVTDENILIEIINHPWRYSGGMVMWAIDELTRIRIG